MPEITNKNVPTNIKIDASTVAYKEKITDFVLSLKADILKGTNQSLQNATSKFMDLWLEDQTDKRFNLARNILAEELSESENVLKKFNRDYLEPSIKIMGQIIGGSKVAEQFDYSVSASSVEALKSAGFKFSINERGQLLAEIAPNVKITSADGREILGSKFSYKFDGTEKGVEITEKPDGSFEFKVSYQDKRTPADVYSVEVDNKVSMPQTDPLYTPGSKYAVVNKDEINYKLSK
ncbi:MAG: hypothetical protein LBE20_06305 [Deltaproteobacteria bacterium]|jgi:hypothetical protein|nr:hypothetical protein [Deltaproteobacteria bacterium]